MLSVNVRSNMRSVAVNRYSVVRDRVVGGVEATERYLEALRQRGDRKNADRHACRLEVPGQRIREDGSRQGPILRVSHSRIQRHQFDQSITIIADCHTSDPTGRHRTRSKPMRDGHDGPDPNDAFVYFE